MESSGRDARSVKPRLLRSESAKRIDEKTNTEERDEIGGDQDLQVRERQARRESDEFRAAGEHSRASLVEVFLDWRGLGTEESLGAIQEGIEAQIAASGVGAKPHFFEPFGAEYSPRIAASLREGLPEGAEVQAVGKQVYVYRPEAVRPVLDSDPEFYRPHGEDDLAAILRVSESGDNGELLGYGARNDFEPGGARVTITHADGFVQIFFVSRAEEAEYWARERAADIEAYTGAPVETVIDIP